MFILYLLLNLMLHSNFEFAFFFLAIKKMKKQISLIKQESYNLREKSDENRDQFGD
jgi:hypothetical protein